MTIPKSIQRLLSYKISRLFLSLNNKNNESKQSESSQNSSHLYHGITGISEYANQIAPRPGTDSESVDNLLLCDQALTLLNAYLLSHDNFQEDISKLKKILEMRHVIFEIGCGMGEAAWAIAKKNPQTGVIAIDKYDWTISVKEGSHYQKMALEWRNKKLKVQHHTPENLVVLRAESDMIRFFPDHCIDTVLMLNPEPKVCEAFLKLICEKAWFQKIKSGPLQIVVVPFSREMGVSACGGFECDYSEKRPGSLDFLTISPFRFRRGEINHWGLDLSRASAYSRNSTRNDIYIYGNQLQEPQLPAWQTMVKKILNISMLPGGLG